MVSQLTRLILAVAAACAVLLLPAYLVGGVMAVAGLVTAALVCLLPGLLVVLFQVVSFRGWSPLSVLMVSMGVRMTVVLASVLVAKQVWPGVAAAQFVGWLIPMYLVALAVETRFALAQTVGRGRMPVDAARLHVAPPLR